MCLNKYDYEWEIDDQFIDRDDTTYAKVIKKIRPNSIVLELGPYKGYLVKYLVEKLNCQVYIVEVNEVAYRTCIAYAKEGFCGDIEKYEWLDAFSGLRFDYIIALDVFEHLYDCEEVFNRSKALLAEHGKYLISIPNIAHTDVILNLLEDKFSYTDTGLLDNTHVRFFARNTMPEIVERCNLYIVEEDATIVFPLKTEQAAFMSARTKDYLDEIVRIHPTGNIYQYVYEISAEKPEVQDFDKSMQSFLDSERFPMTPKLYYDYGEGYSESRCEIIPREFIHANTLDYTGLISENCIQIRFDPVDSQRCMVENLEVTIDGQIIATGNENGIRCGRIDIFFTDDPQLNLYIPKNGKRIRIRANITILGLGSISQVEKVIREEELIISNLKHELDSIRLENSVDNTTGNDE